MSVVKPSHQYYYKRNHCKAPDSRDPSCICWYDAGTGPFDDVEPGQACQATGIVLSWRDTPLRDHEIRELVNQIRDIANLYAGTGQLRDQIAQVLVPVLKKANSDQSGVFRHT